VSPATPLLEHLLAPLQRWLSDPLTEDIAIQRPGEAFVRQKGAWLQDDVQLTLSDLEEIAILAGSLRHQDVGAGAPLCATELSRGERLQICLPPTVPLGTVSLTIRKHEDGIAPLSSMKRRYRIDDWNQWKRRREGRDLAEPLALYDAGRLEEFLAAAVRNHFNILLAGATGSGKTTMAKTLLAEIPSAERLIIIEDTFELNVKQPDTVRLLYAKANIDAPNPRVHSSIWPPLVGPEDLLQASLRMRPDRVILQELRDGSAFTYVSAICSGHPGSVTTIHGATAEDATRRLFVLAKSSPAGAALDGHTLASLISGAIDVIVPLHERDGAFAIGSIWFIADAERRGECLSDLLEHD
jgi:type IV secretion system protein VirB11